MKNELSKAWVEDNSRRVEYPNGVCSIMVFHNVLNNETIVNHFNEQGELIYTNRGGHYDAKYY